MEWFYENGGRQAGPVSREEIQRLIASQHIRPDTLVWTARFGNEWRQASAAGLIPPAVGLGHSDGSASDRWAWIALLVPVLLDWIMISVSSLWDVPALEQSAPLMLMMILHLVIFFVSFTRDRRSIREMGVTPPGFWWWLFLPGYFWVRMQRAGRGRGLFATSVALLVLNYGVNAHFMPQWQAAMRHETQVTSPFDEGAEPSTAPDEHTEI